MLKSAAPNSSNNNPVTPEIQRGSEIRADIVKFFVDLKYLWLEQILALRSVWHYYAALTVILPLSIIFGLGHIGSGLNDFKSQLYIITGTALVLAISDGLVAMAVQIGTMKRTGALLYYASLPISKAAFVLAVLLARLVISLPGMILPLIIGPLMYPIHFQLSPWVLVLLPLTAMSLSVVGMVLGTIIPKLDLIQLLVGVIQSIALVITPIFIPMEALPVPLQIFSYCFPPTYAADALRLALTGNIGQQFYFDLIALVVTCIASFAILTRWLRWKVT